MESSGSWETGVDLGSGSGPLPANPASPPELRERAGVVEAISSVLTSAVAGNGRALFLVGEAGTGKTALLTIARAMASGRSTRQADDQFRVMVVRGSAMERDLPFSFIEQLLGPLHAEGGGRSAGRIDDPYERVAEVYEMGRSRFRQLADLGPALVLLDDLHWADPDSVKLIGFLARRMRSLPVALIGAMRPWPLESVSMVESLVRLDDPGDAIVESEHLVSLSEGATTDLLSSLTSRPIEPGLARRAWVLTEGNPMLVVEAARIVALDGDLPELGVGNPGRLQSALLLSHLEGLSPSTRSVIEAAAVLGARFRLSVVQALVDFDPVPFVSAFDTAVEAGVLRDSGGGWAEFRHDLVATAVYADMPPARRTLLHARAFECYVVFGDPGAAGSHALAADLIGDNRAVSVLLESCEQALRDGAVETCVSQLATAESLAGSEPPDGFLDNQARILMSAGRPGEALAVLNRLLTRSKGFPVSAELLFRAARARAYSGDLIGARSDFDDLVDGSRAGEPFTVRSVLERAHVIWELDGPRAALDSLVFPQSAKWWPAASNELLSLQASFQLHCGDLTGLPELERQVAARRTESPLGFSGTDASSNAFLAYVTACSTTERFEEAEEFIELGLRRMRALGAIPAVIALRICRLGILVHTGALVETLAEVDDLEEEFDLGPLLHPYVLSSKARALAWLGRLTEAEATRQVAASMPGARSWFVTIALEMSRGRQLLAEGGFDAAAECYLGIEAIARRVSLEEPCILPWAAGAVEAYLATGRFGDVARLADWLDRRSAVLPCWWPRMVSQAARAGLAAVGGDVVEARSGYVRASEMPAVAALDRAGILCRYGAWLRRTHQVLEARPILAEALKVAEDRGASMLVDLASSELRAAGGRRRRDRSSSVLTPQQSRIAALAVTGATMREISQSMGISPRTVESHLASIYLKLGVASKSEMRRRRIELGISTS